MKTADHAKDRFEERLPNVPPEVLSHARGMAPRIPDGPENRVHIPLKHEGKEVGYAAYKRVGPERRPVLATILGPNMPPRRSRILTESALKEALEKQASEGSPYQSTLGPESLARAKKLQGEIKQISDRLMSDEDLSSAGFDSLQEQRAALRKELETYTTRDTEALRDRTQAIQERSKGDVTPEDLERGRQELGVPTEAEMAKAREHVGKMRRGELPSRSHDENLKLKPPPGARTQGEIPAPRWSPLDPIFGEDNVEGERAYQDLKQKERELHAHIHALREGPEGVPAANLTPEQMESRRFMHAVTGGTSDPRTTPAAILSDLHKNLFPDSYKNLVGEDGGELSQAQQELRGSKVKDLIDQLGQLPEGDPSRNHLLAQIPAEDRNLQSQVTKAHLGAVLKGVGKSVLTTPKGFGLGMGALAGLTAPQWGPLATRKALQRMHLSPEERNLPEEERDRLTAERSPTYHQLVQQNDESSDITAKDVLQPLGTALNVAQLKPLDTLTGQRASAALDPRRALSEVIGARQLWHGTTSEAGRSILGTPESPGGGIDPGYGGRPTGFTSKATTRQDVADKLKEMVPPGTGLGEAMENPYLKQQVEHLLSDLGTPPQSGGKGYEGLLNGVQPNVGLPGLSAVSGEAKHLDLDTKDFLPNARGNIFMTTDRAGGKSYAMAQNPHLQGAALDQVADAMAKMGPMLQGESPSKVVTTPEGRGALKTLLGGYLDVLKGGKDPDAQEPYLLGTAMPEEDFRERFTADGDNVMQTGAYRLKDEHRVTPYPLGEEPAPGQAPHNMAIPAEDISPGDASFKQIWKARSKNFGRYARGLDLPESERMLGLNKRFLSGLGRSAVLTGLAGGTAYNAFAPLAKKLYRKAQGGPSPEEVPEAQTTLGQLEGGLPKEAATKSKVFAGLRVRIDRPKGFVQEGKGTDGKPWKRVYQCDYGYLAGTQGGDGDGLDVFLGPKEDGRAFLIWQKKEDGTFDEYKLMLGFEDGYQAKAMYLKHVPSRFLGKLAEIPVGVLQGLTGREVDHKVAHRR